MKSSSSVATTQATAAELRARIAAIVDRTNPADVRLSCTCDRCAAVWRETSYRCAFCGYSGPPHTEDCSCEEYYTDAIAHHERTLSTYTAETWPPDWKATAETIKRWLQKDRRNLRAVRARHQSVCEPGTNGSCAHGAPFCPVCTDSGDGACASEEAEHAWSIIRDIRAELAGVGGAP